MNPSFGLSRRAFRLAVLVPALLCALLALLPASAWKPVTASTLMLLNLAGAGLQLRRGARIPEERRGWSLFAGGSLVEASSNLILALTFLKGGVAENGWLAINFSGSLLQLAGVMAFPTPSGRYGRASRRVVDGLLFGIAIFFAYWILGIGTPLPEELRIPHYRATFLVARIALVSGAVIFLAADRPGRLPGPLGWLLATNLFGMVIATFWFGWSVPVRHEEWPRWLVLMVWYPWGPVLAALSPGCLAASHAEGGRARLRDALPYLPLIGALALFGVLQVTRKPPVDLPTLLMGLSLLALLIVRQFQSVRDLRGWSRRLEERVLERTRDLEAAQELLLRTERMNTVASLGAGMAHDLKNLLGVVKNFAILVGQDQADGRAADPEDLATIQRAADQAADLADQLMNYGRGEAEVQARTFDLAARLRADLELLRAALPKSIVLEGRLPEAPLPLRGDPGQLDQVVVNLVLNARDALPGGGRIRVAAGTGTLPDGRPAAALEVEDTGTGMPPEVMERIFAPFFTTKAKGVGTGLGLASVKAIVEGMEGRLAVESEPGRGTRFTLLFPSPGG